MPDLLSLLSCAHAAQDEPQGNQVFCQMNECIPEVVKACIKETGVGKLFSANITADDPNEMIARVSQFGPLSENCAFLVDGYVAGGTAVLRPPQLPQAVLALSPSRTRIHDQPPDPAPLHRLCAHEDLPSHRCIRHPQRHHELRQDGERCL